MQSALLNKKSRGPGKLHSKAQVMLELSVAMIASIILIIGIARIFVWLNQCLVERQVAYQQTRTQPRTRIVDFYDPSRDNKLQLFK